MKQRAGQPAATGSLGALISFESLRSRPMPLAPRWRALEDDGKVPLIRGGLPVIRNDTVEYYQSGAVYQIGSLSLRKRFWFHLSQHVILLTLVALSVVVLIAPLLYGGLQRRVARTWRTTQSRECSYKMGVMFLSGSSTLVAETAIAAGARCDAWPAWQRFKSLYSSPDGRIIDASTARQITTSNGQSHALFFALVGNDRSAFDQLLRWTQNNLAGGSLEQNLPAWQWGRADDGEWRVLDANACADADLWIAYVLGEAGRLWNEAEYSELGAAVAENILRREVVLIPGLGRTLLPGPAGFVDERGWRLNPSYLPLPIIRGLARQTGDAIWNEIALSSERIILGSAPDGFAADWVEFTAGSFVPDRKPRGIRSYDAIRVYLWAGMLPASDPSRDKITAALQPVLSNLAKPAEPVESVATQTLEMRGEGSPGFSAAVLPMLANAHLTSALQCHRKRAAEGALQDNQCHYSDVLTLFGLGWLEQRYRFNRAGLLNVRWTPACNRVH